MLSKQKLNNLPTEALTCVCINLPSTTLTVWFTDCVYDMRKPKVQFGGLFSLLVYTWILVPLGSLPEDKDIVRTTYTPHYTHLYVDSCREFMPPSVLYMDE